MDIVIRKAEEKDRADIAFCIAEGFRNDFLPICKSVVKVAFALQSGIRIEKFYVAEVDGQVVGTLAISDSDGRAVYTDKKSYKKQFGFFNGWIAGIVLKTEFEQPICYPKTTGYLEFVSVREDFKRCKIATEMIKRSMDLSGYDDFKLDVTDVNIGAINCYASIGFKQFKVEEEKNSKHKGFNSKIFMEYKNNHQ